MTKLQKTFGIVEGFFSDPLPTWTWSQRYSTIKFINKYAPCINTYFYCPKQDPFVTKKWSKLYSKKELKNISNFIDTCKEKKLRFVYGFNPTKLELESIQNKINQLLTIGCTNLCLLFDDIPEAYSVLESKADRQMVLTAQNIISVANQIYSNNGINLWLCFPDYCFKKSDAFNTCLRVLNPEIDVIWTGNDVFVKTITSKDISRVKKIIGRDKKIMWWSNYPVNDCEQSVGEFNLGGFTPPQESSVEKLSGILVNPMRECFANLPFYVTFSNYINKPSAYQRTSAWNQGLKTVLGTSWKKYKTIFSITSSNNMSDKKTAPKNILFGNLPAIKSLWGKLFINDIGQLLLELGFLKKVIAILSKESKLKMIDFLPFDRFPTRTTIPRYASEIRKIVSTRSKLYKKQDFATLIKIEQVEFLRYLNSLASPSEKIKLLFKRRYINRFSL